MSWRAMRRARGLAVAGVLATLSGAVRVAQAQNIPESDWRREHRRVDPEEYGSPKSFAFEVRFGPYKPEVDEELEGRSPEVTPFRDVFGDDQRFYFGVELDWLPLRIPWVGLVGPGFGWGITGASGAAMLEGSCQAGVAGSCQPHPDAETAITIMPMHLSGVLRADELMRRTGVPIVPYVKLGLGLATWRVSSPSGTADSYECGSDGCDNVKGKGTTWGIHLAAGGMLSLNWLDPRAAVSLDESTGVNGAYLFGEWMNAQLDGLGSKPQMHVGTSTWVVGLALEM